MHLGAVYNMHRHAADLRETGREMSPEKRTLVSLIIPQSVELLKGPQLVGFSSIPKGKSNWCQPREGMSDSIGQPRPVGALSIGWAGVGEVHPPTSCYVTSVSRRDTLRVRKGLWHPFISQ